MKQILTPNAVLVYHRIVSSPFDLNLLNVTPQNFREHIIELVNKRNILPLKELITQVKMGIALPGSIAITFDDGYMDFVNYALPILNEYNIPATIFTTTKDRKSPNNTFWWDKIENFLFTSDYKSICRLLNIDAINGSLLNEVLNFQRTLMKLPAETINKILKKNINNIKVQHQILSLNELAEKLINNQNISVGSHSINHSQMSILSHFYQKEELYKSRERIIDIFKHKFCNIFSLPFGHTESWNKDTINISRSVGYDGLLSTQQNMINNDSLQYVIPRLLVRNWSKSEFNDWLENNYSLKYLDLSIERRNKQFDNYFTKYYNK